MADFFSPVGRVDQLRDVDITERADGRTWVWDDAAGTHVYVALPEGGGGGGAGLVLVDSSDQGWMVTADTDGALVTTQTAEPGEDEVQVGPYMLSVDTDGVLVTTEVA